MSGDAKSQPSALDRADVRVRHDAGFAGAVRGFIDRVRSGDLGSLPVVVGLVLICAVFQTLNPVFLSSGNLVDLLFDSSTVGVISLGIVCILIVGEIDLSVGSVSGLASAILGVLWVNAGWPVGIAILVALVVGCAIGIVYATLFNGLGMPSFVSTLAGLLAALGLQLYLLGATGSINLTYGSALVDLGQTLIMPHVIAYGLVLIAGIAIFITGSRRAAQRRAAGLTPPSIVGILARAVVLTVVLEFVVWYLNQDRGVPWMFGLFVGLVVAMDYALTRTKWGRSM
ncbi:MAG: ABC transporter permease subunit, partial [Marmoricola sp.]